MYTWLVDEQNTSQWELDLNVADYLLQALKLTCYRLPTQKCSHTYMYMYMYVLVIQYHVLVV